MQENWYFLLLINTLFAWRLGIADLIAVEILFFLVFRCEHLGKFCTQFEFPVSNPPRGVVGMGSGATPAPIWPKFDKLFCKNCVWQFLFFFYFQIYSLLSTGGGSNFSPRNIFTRKNETFLKSETAFFKQTWEEMKAILIVFFRLFFGERGT